MKQESKAWQRPAIERRVSPSYWPVDRHACMDVYPFLRALRNKKLFLSLIKYYHKQEEEEREAIEECCNVVQYSNTVIRTSNNNRYVCTTN